ncbi:MAG: glycosyltransferase [Chitinophagales bacterium]|jgi:glycosyltransferase involved in cell wall biosynthesis|nr:glycosyltransferase [Chitinophagales bacterium]
MENIKFSIIIPTRDRAETLRYTLKTLVNLNYKNAEFIISDNCSSDNTSKVIKEFVDPRIIHIMPEKRLSMSHNFEFAFSYATGDFITCMGDDDGILPETLNYVCALINKYGKMPISTQYSKFNWGNNYFKPNFLSINMRSGYRVYNTKETLKRFFEFKNYYSSLPIVYYGFIPRDLYESVKEKSSGNSFFQSMIPDVYSSLVLSNFTEHHIVSLRPLFIAGISKFSNGQSTLTGKNEKEKNEGLKFLSEAPSIPFHPKVAFSLSSIYLIILESYFQLLDNVSDVRLNLNIEKFLNKTYHIHCSQNDPKIIEAIQETCKINKIVLDTNFKIKKQSQFSKFKTKLKYNLTYYSISDENIENIENAVRIHESIYNSKSHLLFNFFRRLSEIISRTVNL